MTTVLSNSYDYLVGTLNHMKILKHKDNPRRNVADCCEAILVHMERFKSDGTFKPNHLGYIICMFEDTFYSRFHLWETQVYGVCYETFRV